MPEIKFQSLFTAPRQQQQALPLQQRMLADNLQRQQGQAQPVYSPLHGAAIMGEGVLGGILANYAQAQERGKKAQTTAALTQAAKAAGIPDFAIAAGQANPSMLEGALAQALQQRMAPPALVDGYNAQGLPIKQTWSGGNWQQVGGAKSDAISPDAEAQRNRMHAEQSILPQPAEAQKIRIAAAGKPDTTINNAVNPIIKGIGEQFMEQRAAARAAADQVQSLYQARSQLQQGIKSGAVADLRLQAAKIGSFLGLDDKTIANTETFKAAAGKSVLDLVKGLGAGASISNADREFAEKMAGGSVALDNDSLDRINKIAEQAARDKIKQYNSQAESLYAGMPELEKFRGAMNVQAPIGYDEYLAAHPELLAPPAAVVPPPPGAVPAAPGAIPADPLGLR